MPTLCRGRIIWATVPDPRGQNPKRRPLVVVTPDAELAAGGPVRAVATSTLHDAAAADVCVPLPWERTGHPRTKLRTACVAVCTWVVALPAAAVEELGGIVPGRQMYEIEDILNRLAGGPPPG